MRKPPDQTIFIFIENFYVKLSKGEKLSWSQFQATMVSLWWF